jgi:short-subunit dehydrogenase
MQLRGRTVLITGASTGIGAATARAMSARGATVILVARSEDKLRALADDLPGTAAAYPCDVGDHVAVAAMAERVRAENGTPDLIVNNAGAGRWLFIEETDPEEFRQMVAVPFMAAFFVTRAFIQEMLDRGSGWIVNVNTPICELAWPGALGYGCARAGMRGFDATLAADLRGTGIGVTTVIPGKVSSEYFEHNPGTEDRVPSIERLMRTLTPDDVAESICGAVERERRHVVQPLTLRLLLLQNRVMPRFGEWLAWRTGARRPSAN